MSEETFRRHAHALVDWIIDYQERRVNDAEYRDVRPNPQPDGHNRRGGEARMLQQ